MSSDAAIPKPSQLGDCPACNHAFPANKVCPGGPAYCGGPREGCPRCGQPVPTDIVPPGIVPPEPARLDDLLPIPVAPIDMRLTYTPDYGGVSIRNRARFTFDEHTLWIEVAHKRIDRSARRELVDRLADVIEREIKAAEGV